MANPNPKISNLAGSTPKDAAQAIGYVDELFSWPMIDVSDPEAMTQRIHDYHELCQRYKSKLLVSGLCLALGTDREEVQRWSKGQNTGFGKRLSAESALILQRELKLLETAWEFSFQNGGYSQPVAGIFLAKNNFGYKDESGTVIRHESEKDGLSKKELQEKYSKALPVEAVVEDD